MVRLGRFDQLIARIAGRQHGVVARWQLIAIGVPAGAIEKRLAKGWLIRVHRGVYRVGHAAPSVEATWTAAVLACGDGAALAGHAAAHLYGLIRGAAPRPEVMAPSSRVVEGVTSHRARRGDSRDFTTYRGIPITTVLRTLVDLAATASEDDLARAVHEAGIRFSTDPAAVEAVLSRRPRSKGARTLRGILRGDVHITLSRLERAFLKLLRDAALPLPRTNRPAGGHYVDCRWPDRKLTVELDGYRYHASRHAFEQGRLREREAYARGDQFRRYTWGDVSERATLVVTELRAVLV